jgi:hypothetical protein
MSHRNSARWQSAVLLAFCLSGCADYTTSPPAELSHHRESKREPRIVSDIHSSDKELEMSDEIPRKLIVSKSTEEDLLVRLGVVSFDESNRATLSTEGSGPEVDQLKQDWQEVTNSSELMWKKSVPGEVDGEKVWRIVAETVRPGDEHYIYAVLNTLERMYGYRVDYDD